MKRISLIVAMSENNVIGISGKLPWHISEDLKRFKRLTLGKPIIMGRKTYESIGNALPGRMNIVLTNDMEFAANDCTIVHSPANAISIAPDNVEIMIIGGEKIYKEFLSKSQKIYLTLIHAKIAGDTVFPELRKDEWKEVEREYHGSDDKHAYDYSFITLQRKTQAVF